MSGPEGKGGQRLWALFTDAPQIDETERACHYIRLHKEQRDSFELDTRPWHVERIKMDWWVKELLRITEGSEEARP